VSKVGRACVGGHGIVYRRRKESALRLPVIDRHTMHLEMTFSSQTYGGAALPTNLHGPLAKKGIHSSIISTPIKLLMTLANAPSCPNKQIAFRNSHYRRAGGRGSLCGRAVTLAWRIVKPQKTRLSSAVFPL
jgi:hypothetical protein